MRQIRRYALTLEREQDVTMPLGSLPLRVDAVNDMPVIWAMVNPDAWLITCTVRLFDDGEEFQEWSEDQPDGFRGDSIGSVILSNGRFLHLVRQVK